MEITFGNLYTLRTRKTDLFINDVLVDEVFDNDTKTFKSTYTGTPTFRMSENFSIMNADLIIRLFNIETYTIDFTEETEISVLLLDDTKYVETDPFLFSGIGNITVGTSSTFNAITTTTNSTPYNSGFLSGITGQGITYNTAQVIIKYKYTKPIIIQVPNEGYLNYKLTGWEVSDIVGDTNNLIQNTSNYILDTSNIITTRIDNLPVIDLQPYRLISDSYTQAQIDTKDTNNSNVISLRINALPPPQDLTPYRLISDSYTQAEIDTKDTNNSNVISLRINALPPPPNLAPYRLISDSYTQAQIDTKDTNNSNVISLRINALPSPQNYTLPTSTASIRGGIRVGTNLSISGDVLSGLAPPNLAPYRLISDSYTQAQIDTKDTNTSNVISTRINALPAPYDDTNVVYNIALLSSQLATLLQNIQNSRSINVVYERELTSVWTAVEGNNAQMLVDQTVVIRLKPSSFFPTNTTAPYSILVTNTKTTNNTTTNTTTVFNNTAITNIFTLQYNGMTQHNILIRITSNDGFVSPNFIFRIRSFANLFGG
jgi:hypothetical protein